LADILISKIMAECERFRLISGLEKLSQDRTVSNSAEKACSKLLKPSHDCSTVKTNKSTIL